MIALEKWVVSTPILEVITPQELATIGHVYLPGLIAETLQIAIESVKPVEKYGRIYFFDVVPAKRYDPRLIVTKLCDMSKYYEVWGKAARGVYRLTYEWENSMEECDKAIEQCLSTLQGATPEERHILHLELLRWKNDVRRQ